MQLHPSDIPLVPRRPPWKTRRRAKLWLEQEDPDEVKKIEELKNRQKALEKELSEKRKKQQEQTAQPG